ncbi:MAG TPA: alpha/beta hydrolase [Thermoanaerobaculia bacterium]|nr:alpha/beta hydrolase [Thermoanaerobaculia bacterium]
MNERNRFSLLVAIALSLSIVACQGDPPPEAPPAADTTRTGLTPGEHTFTSADGSEIPYEIAGEGDATVVLVHCSMCEGSFWAAQVPVLAERYRTLTLDLPGHGKASAARAEWTVAGYGEDVAAMLRELDLSNVVLVGHSMGGPVSLRAAALSPGRVRGIVAVDTLHDAEFDMSAALESFLPAFEADYSATCDEFVDSMFPEENVDEIKATVRAKGCSEDRREIGIALMRNFGDIDMTSWFSDAGVPIRAINAPTNPTQVENNRKYADFEAVILENVGHFPHMTRPEQFNPLLLDAVAQLLAAPAA